MATKAELRDRAANDLGLLRLGQSLQAQDTTRIESAFDEVYADLKTDGLNVWASTASCPVELVPHVVALIADNCLNTYGVSPARYQRIKIASGNAKREMRRLITLGHESVEDATDY